MKGIRETGPQPALVAQMQASRTEPALVSQIQETSTESALVPRIQETSTEPALVPQIQETSTESALIAQVALLPHEPGVYRFLDPGGKVLYVGKAKDLKKRVASYFNRSGLTTRILGMLSRAATVEITVTATENDALILEATLIKQYRPRYNVLMRDDKSYPYILLTTDHPFPRVTLYRGNKDQKGRYFGPFPSTVAVRETLKQLQQLFPIRHCPDEQFSSRQRPCLQYQIKRCAGPCCGCVKEEQYQHWVQEIGLFLAGKDRSLVASLQQAMWTASQQRDFEKAIQLRDRLKAVEHVQAQRRLNLSGTQDVDVIAIDQEGGVTVIQIFLVRAGINLGNREILPQNSAGENVADILESFIGQHYADRPPPPEVLVNQDLPDPLWLARALSSRHGKTVRIHHPVRGEKRKILEMAEHNARQSLLVRLRGQEVQQRALAELGDMLGLTVPPQRVEVYDVSHHQSSEVVGARIVFAGDGFCKEAYRKYLLNNPEWLDDTARMAAMLVRRFEKEEELPDVIILDGGKGQLNAVLAALPPQERVAFCALAKGEDRHAGQEHLFLPGQMAPVMLQPHSGLLFFLQKVRDEAHRCAIGFHRKRQQNRQFQSVLDDIPGIGPKRRNILLRTLGSAQAIQAANLETLCSLPGIPETLAKRIFQHFHNIG